MTLYVCTLPSFLIALLYQYHNTDPFHSAHPQPNLQSRLLKEGSESDRSAASPAARLARPGPLDTSSFSFPCTRLYPRSHSIMFTTPSDHPQQFVKKPTHARRAAHPHAVMQLAATVATPVASHAAMLHPRVVIHRQLRPCKLHQRTATHLSACSTNEGLEALMSHLPCKQGDGGPTASTTTTMLRGVLRRWLDCFNDVTTAWFDGCVDGTTACFKRSWCASTTTAMP